METNEHRSASPSGDITESLEWRKRQEPNLYQEVPEEDIIQALLGDCNAPEETGAATSSHDDLVPQCAATETLPAYIDLTQDDDEPSISPDVTQSLPPAQMATPQQAMSSETTPPSRASSTSTLSPAPHGIHYLAFDHEIREKNLVPATSLIEMGKLHKDSLGRVYWVNKLHGAPDYIDENNAKRVSPAIGRPMQFLPFLPDEIDSNAPAWQLVLWFRSSAEQDLQLTQKDIFDRMPANSLTHSGLTNRMQKWQREVGMLPQTATMTYNWPSKTSMETISQLSYLQLKFNTWWHIRYIEEQGTYMVTQPSDHPGYSQRYLKPPLLQPFYLILHPEKRQMSEQVKLLDDAMMFLTIKAEESGDPDGFDGIMKWLSHPNPNDPLAAERAITLVQEFQRWRQGCPDTPSVSVLRAALNCSKSQEEHDAIMRADYSLTPWLQNIVGGLTPMREARTQEDLKTRGEMTSKKEARKNKKRKSDEVVDLEADTGANKKQAT